MLLHQGNYDLSKLDNGEDEIITTEKMIITFTTTINQKNNINENITIINLDNCEEDIRNYYHLKNNDIIYIKKTEVKIDGMKIPKIEYDIYSKLKGKLEKLNITVCKDSKILLSIPIDIPKTENIDILNISSRYYNDICYISTSDSGTDIIIKDRKNEFKNGNKTICQDDCDFTEYNYTTKKAICSCDAKGSSISFADITINKNKLLKNLKDIKSFINFNILPCYKVLLSKKSILSNIGFYIICLIFIFHIISTFIFYIKQYNIINEKIKDIIYAIKNFELINRKKKNNLNNNLNNNIVNNHKNTNIININNTDNKKKKFKNKKKKSKGISKVKKKKNKNIISKKNNLSNNISSNNRRMITSNNIGNNTRIEQNKINKIKTIMEYIDDEMNDLSYELAIENDKRTFSIYYISLIKTKHPIIFSFYYNNDYNSKIIKIDLFFIDFTILYTINALFFNDNTMHIIYENKGKFDIEYQLPKIIYSSLISMILNTIIKLLSLSNDLIIELKQNKEKIDIDERKDKLKNKLNIKFSLYFIISFILLLLFWYYISMFGTIYRNTQLHLLKDTLMSFVLSLIYPFALYLLPGIFRIPALSDDKKNKKCLYDFSKLLHIF